jgi:ADP-ribose pyrophosphatase YjhB (NUDIX family)
MDNLYCQRCASILNKSNDKLFICPKCDFHLYINPLPCNALILENASEEILLVKRKTEPFSGYWDIPGGFIEPEETAEESLIRECQEELGVTLPNYKYFSSYFDRYLFKGNNYHTLGFVFVTKIDSNLDFKPADDISEVQFFPKKEIPWEKLAFKTVKIALQDYLNIQNNF